MHGKEEWVIGKLGSQRKCIERPVWLWFPGYLSVSSDYGKSYEIDYFPSGSIPAEAAGNEHLSVIRYSITRLV